MPRKEYIAWFDVPKSSKMHGQSVMPRQELIRCKDCKYYSLEQCEHPEWSDPADVRTPYPSTVEDDFCSRAERKEE